MQRATLIFTLTSSFPPHTFASNPFTLNRTHFLAVEGNWMDECLQVNLPTIPFILSCCTSDCSINSYDKAFIISVIEFLWFYHLMQTTFLHISIIKKTKLVNKTKNKHGSVRMGYEIYELRGTAIYLGEN